MLAAAGRRTAASTRNAKLARTVRQQINRAVNDRYREHAGSQIACERLNVATMRRRARRMNASLYASNLAHVPRQVVRGVVKRGVGAAAVKSASTAQECPCCHIVSRSNRPEQHTVCCGGLRLARRAAVMG